MTSIVKNGCWFLAAVVITPVVLYLVATFWPFWPASHVGITTSGERVLKGNATGCLVYHIMIGADRGLDDAYLKVRFPMKVLEIRAGIAASDALSRENGVRMSLGEIGKDINGNCHIVQTAGIDESEITAKIIQRAVVIQIPKMEADTFAMALVVGQDERAPEQSEAPLEHEGHFSASLLGYQARREIPFQDLPVQEAK